MIEIRQIPPGPEGRETWLSWRKGVLTASDIGAVAGVDTYRTPLAVYAEKTAGITAEETPQMVRGRHAEGMALCYLQDAHPGWRIERPNAFYLDVDIGIGCTPDAFARDGGRLVNVQIKTVAAPVFAGWDGRPPQSYVLQTATENMLTKADEGLLAVLVLSAYSAELIEFPVPRHEAAEKRLYGIARDFWANVRNGLVPAPDYRQDADIVSMLYPPDPAVPQPLDLFGDNRIVEVLTRREGLKDMVKAYEADIKALDAEIVDKLKGAERAVTEGWKITHSITRRGQYIVPAKEFPVLRVARTKEEA